MERQKRNEMVCAHNLINSRNNEERKTRIDDGERPAGTTNDGDGQSTIYSILVHVGDIMVDDGVSLVFER